MSCQLFTLSFSGPPESCCYFWDGFPASFPVPLGVGAVPFSRAPGWHREGWGRQAKHSVAFQVNVPFMLLSGKSDARVDEGGGQSTRDLPLPPRARRGKGGDSADGLTLCCVPHSLVPAEAPCPPGREEESDDGQHGHLDVAPRDLEFVTTAVAFSHVFLSSCPWEPPSIKSCPKQFCVSVSDTDVGGCGVQGGQAQLGQRNRQVAGALPSLLSPTVVCPVMWALHVGTDPSQFCATKESCLRQAVTPQERRCGR